MMYLIWLYDTYLENFWQLRNFLCEAAHGKQFMNDPTFRVYYITILIHFVQCRTSLMSFHSCRGKNKHLYTTSIEWQRTYLMIVVWLLTCCFGKGLQL